MTKRLVQEHFDSIRQLLDTLEKRPNNEVMKKEKSSEKGSKSFTGTDSYKEATELIKNGYKEILPQIKKETNKHLKLVGISTKTRPRNAIVGYVPNIPNAIQGLPESMIYTERIKQKSKTVSILYSPSANAGTSANEIIKCGITLLNLINTLESQGIRVNLRVAGKLSYSDNEMSCMTIKVKDYKEHLNLQKICFPIAHPSMLRRIGFKWLETSPNVKDKDWVYGYGASFSSVPSKDKNLKELLKQVLRSNESFISIPTIQNAKYDVNELIKDVKTFESI